MRLDCCIACVEFRSSGTKGYMEGDKNTASAYVPSSTSARCRGGVGVLGKVRKNRTSSGIGGVCAVVIVIRVGNGLTLYLEIRRRDNEYHARLFSLPPILITPVHDVQHVALGEW